MILRRDIGNFNHDDLAHWNLEVQTVQGGNIKYDLHLYLGKENPSMPGEYQVHHSLSQEHSGLEWDVAQNEKSFVRLHILEMINSLYKTNPNCIKLIVVILGQWYHNLIIR